MHSKMKKGLATKLPFAHKKTGKLHINLRSGTAENSLPHIKIPAKRTLPKSSMATPTLISSLPDLQASLSLIPPSSTLYLDLEGRNLSRHGTLTLLTILVLPTRATSIVDVQTLGDSAFTTPGPDGKTLKAILEDPNTSKCLWDVRNDADALWAHHKIRLAGVTDIQLLENGSRPSSKTYLFGLDRCIEKDLSLRWEEKQPWARTKQEVRALMNMPNSDIFSRRPLDAKTLQYCVNDVVYLPALHKLYTKRINKSSGWLAKAMVESARRVTEACGPGYVPQSEDKKFGPWRSRVDPDYDFWF